MKIVVCGGGTLGHVTPTLAVVEALRAFEPTVEILYVGSGNEQEAKMVRSHGLEYSRVSSGKFRRYGRGLKAELTDFGTLRKNSADSVRLLRGIVQSKKLLRRFKPDVVFCKGGFVTVPMGIAAGRKKIPLIIHESDSEFGMSNKILASRAQKIAVGFPLDTYKGFEYFDKLEFSGNPVRSQLVGKNRDSSIKNLNLPDDKPIIFIFGGSQGTAVINEEIFNNLELFCSHFTLIHQTGSADIERARFLRHNLEAKHKKYYHPFDYLQTEMADAFAAASVVVGRASAGTIAEIAANKKPAILIPNAGSSNNHQQKNADILLSLGAVRILNEAELGGLKLQVELDKLLHDHSAMSYLAKTVGKLYREDAASTIAKLIIRAGKGETLAESQSENLADKPAKSKGN